MSTRETSLVQSRNFIFAPLFTEKSLRSLALPRRPLGRTREEVQKRGLVAQRSLTPNLV